MRLPLSLFLLLSGLFPSCQTKETKHYQVERFPDGSMVREEIKNGVTNGRTVGYFPTGEIKYILEVVG